MKMRRMWPVLCGLLAMAGGVVTPARAAKAELWTDPNGKAFKAEAAGVLGPLALFRSGRNTGVRLPLHLLSAEDCVRFHRATRELKPASGDWGKSSGSMSYDLAQGLLKVEGEKLVPLQIVGRPEPEFFVLFFASSGIGDSWGMLSQGFAPYQKLKAAHPAEFEAVFVGFNHSQSDHRAMAVSMKVPWPVADLRALGAMASIREMLPGDGFGVAAVTRDGVILFGATSPSAADVAKVFDDLGALLDLLRADNPRTWQDRAHYLRAIQPVAYADGRSEPVLVGNPLRVDGLKQRQVTMIDATLAVAADGQVTGVELKPEGVPDVLRGALAEALQKSTVFVPAVDHGQFVAGTYRYRLEVTP